MPAAACRKPPGPGPVSAAAGRARAGLGVVAGCSSGATVEQARKSELAAAQARAADAERKVADQQAELDVLAQQIAELELRLLEAGGELPAGSAGGAAGSDGAGSDGAGSDGAEPAVAAPDVRLTGNLGEVPAGTPGELQAVAVGAVGRSGRVPWIGRNATDQIVVDVNVVVTARDGQGTLVGSGGTLAVAPFVVRPGEVAIGDSFLSGDDLPDDIDIDLEVEVSSDADPFTVEVDVPVTEVSVREDGITGIVASDSGRALCFVSVLVVCTDEQGNPTHAVSEFTDRSELPAGATSPFSGRLFDVDCSGYLAGAGGRQ